MGKSLVTEGRTLIASLSLGGIGEAIILEGATQTAAFELYVEHILGPSLEPGQIVVLDNLRIHKGERVRQIIEARGCHVLFLPAYSPDFSPIEEAFSKHKAFLRKVGVRTREDLQEVLIQALGIITPQNHEVSGLPNTLTNDLQEGERTPPGILRVSTYVRLLLSLQPGYGGGFAPILEKVVEVTREKPSTR